MTSPAEIVSGPLDAMDGSHAYSRRVSTVRRRLVQLAAAVAVPLVLLSALTGWGVYRSERNRQEDYLVGRAEAAAESVDRAFDAAIAALRVLAASRALATGDLEGFDLEMRQASIALGGASLNLIAANGNVTRSTVLPAGGPPQPIQASGFALGALHAGGPVVSNLIQGQLSGLLHFGIALPVPPAPSPAVGSSGAPPSAAWVLTFYFPADGLSRALADLHLPPGWVASVSDRANRTVARTRQQENAIGRLPPPDVLAAVEKGRVGLIDGDDHQTLDGEATLAAFARAPVTGYLAVVGIPRAEFSGPLRATLLRTGALAAMLTGLGVGGALLLARRIVGGLRAVAQAPAGNAPPTGLREIDELARAIAAAEARRQDIAENFRVLADTLPGWVFITDPTGHNTYVNATMIEQSGRSEADLMRDGWVPMVHPDDQSRVAETWRQAVAAGVDYQLEYRFRMSDSTYRWILVRARPRRDADGAIISWFGVAIDIHNQRETEDALRANEAALRSLNQELESRVQAEIAVRESTQMRVAQAERLQALGQLAGGIAHDFNNILQGVQGAATLIERRAADAAQVVKLARLITEASNRGANITRRLLALSRRDHLQPEPIGPLALLLGMRELLAHTMGDGIEITVDAAANLPPMLADKGTLETVLINLATNARDAMSGNGCVRLSAGVDEIAARPAPTTVAGRRTVDLPAGAYVRLAVADAGTGMDAMTLARASEPFFTTKPMGKGTGLGLAISRGFAEQSGGGMEIESHLGEGTTIRLWLPQAAVTTGAGVAAAAPGTAPLPASRARLLLIDDDAVVRQTLAQQLDDAGYAVLPCASAAYALALLDAGELVDLIVSDVSMPGMTGSAMIREARRRRPGLKAILVTGFTADAAEIVGDPDVILLHKPITGAALAEQVMASLGRETKKQAVLF